MTEEICECEDKDICECTTWRAKITGRLVGHKEAWDDVVLCTLSEGQLDIIFSDGFGGVEGIPFTVWTRKRVYFPWCYDGAEGVASVSRIPDGKPTEHVGGG